MFGEWVGVCRKERGKTVEAFITQQAVQARPGWNE